MCSGRIRALVALALGTGIIAACASDDSVEAASYDQSCAADSDCAAVAELKVSGSMCSERCPSAAINAKEVEKFRADIAARKKDCDSFSQPTCGTGTSKALCRASRCAFVDCTKESCGPADAGTD